MSVLFSMKPIVDECCLQLLSEHLLCGTRTLKDVIAKYSSVVNIPITKALLSEYRKAHSEYKIALDKTKIAKEQKSNLGKRKLPLNDVASQIASKKLAFENKQQQAEKMVTEGTERLGAALKSGKIEDGLPAQALLESGNQILKECRHELQQLNQSGAHQPGKSTL